MTSTPLPEQGGFNERLTAILAEHIERNVRNGMRFGAKQEREKIAIFPFSIDEPVGELRTAIRTLVLEEIIGEAEQYIDHRNSTTDRLKGWNDGISCVVREQRKKLGGL